jgi:ATP-dependent helicase/nuclease subunit A
MILPSVIAKDAFTDHFCISNFLPPTINRYKDIAVQIVPKYICKEVCVTDKSHTMESFIQIKQNDVHIGYQYLHENLLDIPSKKSVSNLYTNESAYLDTQKQVITTHRDNEDHVISAATKGTAFHVFMQHVDLFSKSVQDIENQKDQMVKKNILNEKEASTIPIEKVYNLLCSEVFERVKKASVCYREKNFTIKADSKSLGFDPGEYILIQGTIDCCFLEDNAYVIIDYKTDQIITQQKIEKYTKQLDYYSKALEKITNFSVKQRYLYFINDKFYSV